MTKQNCHGKNNRYKEKTEPIPFLIPKNQRHKKRKTGMSGEKQIPAEEKTVAHDEQIRWQLICRRSDVGKNCKK